MKRGLFIIYNELDNTSGVNKKIRNQIDALNNEGMKTDTILMKPKTVKGYKFLYRMPFSNLAPCWKYNQKIKEYDFIYLRRPFFMNHFFICFLRQVKINNPNIKIIMEIPTFPYDKEIVKKIANYTILIKDIIARRQIKKYIDRITVVGNENELFGLKTIKIYNGYDVRNIRKRKVRSNNNTINLVAVAVFDYWHGYDRIIEGLKDYYEKDGDREINIFMVGDGPERRNYEKIVHDLKLEKHVQFLNMLGRQDIIKIYDNSDFGICSLGAYRKDLFYSCELKSREYLSVGLPIITGVRLDVMDNDKINKYILEFPNDDSVIDFNKIIEFYENLYIQNDSPVSMIQEIRSYAESELDMKNAIGDLIEYIREA